jgi:hypothetical protein
MLSNDAKIPEFASDDSQDFAMGSSISQNFPRIFYHCSKGLINRKTKDLSLGLTTEGLHKQA